MKTIDDKGGGKQKPGQLSSTARACPRLHVGRGYFFDKVKYLFEKYLDDGLLLFLDEKKRLPLRVDPADARSSLVDVVWLSEMLATQRIKTAAELADRPTTVKLLDGVDARSIDPGADFRRLILRTLDLHRERLSLAKIQEVINILWVTYPVEAKAYGDKPAPKTVRDWLNTRGLAGSRTWNDCISRCGKGPRRPRLNEIVRLIVCEGALLYWADRTMKQRHAFDMVVEKIDLENRQRAPDNQAEELKPPSKSTFQQYVWQLANFDTYKSKFGLARARKFFSASGKSIISHQILELCMIDHTVLDCVAVDADTKAVIGRPVLTLMVCAFSRCVLGYYLSFDPPSLSTVIECLKHAFAPKIGCIGSDEFPILQDISGVPTEIVVDNGLEFVGVSLQDVSADLGITLTAAPVKSPTYKIYVERFFRTLNDLGIHSFPGTTLNKQEMLLRDNNFTSIPVMSLEQLRGAIERAIYAFHIDGHASLGERPPALVWQDSAIRNGIPAFYDFDVLESLLGVATNRILGRDGIEIHGLQYNHGPTTNTLLHELFDGERHRKQASIPVKIKYYPSDLGAIRVYHHKRNEYVQLPCVDPDYARGLSLFQHNQIKAHVRQAALEFSTPAQRRRARLAVLDAVYEVNPRLRQTQKKALARLKTRPAVQKVMKIKGVGQSDAFVLLPHEPMTALRRDEGVLPKITPRGAAKAKMTRARKVAERLTINRAATTEHLPYETDLDQNLWNGYSDE